MTEIKSITFINLQLFAEAGTMVNATGAGDAFMAGLTWAYLEGTDLENTVKLASAAAAIAIEGTETINPNMSPSSVKERAGL